MFEVYALTRECGFCGDVVALQIDGPHAGEMVCSGCRHSYGSFDTSPDRWGTNPRSLTLWRSIEGSPQISLVNVRWDSIKTRRCALCEQGLIGRFLRYFKPPTPPYTLCGDCASALIESRDPDVLLDEAEL